MQGHFNKNICFPISYSNFPPKIGHEKIDNLGKVDITCGEHTLLNFTLKFITSNDLKYFEIKNRECKITFDGNFYKDSEKIASYERYLSYSISENLHIKRAAEIYKFFQDLFSGKNLELKINNINSSLSFPNKIERFKLKRVSDIINKYLFLCYKEQVAPNEKVSNLLKKSYDVDILYRASLGESVGSMVDLSIPDHKFIEGDSLVFTKTIKSNIKGLNSNITETITFEEPLTKGELSENNLSVYGKKVQVIFKKNLDF